MVVKLDITYPVYKCLFSFEMWKTCREIEIASNAFIAKQNNKKKGGMRKD